jgi:hypothetical protein
LVIEREDILVEFIKDHIENLHNILNQTDNEKIMNKEDREKYEKNLLTFFKYFFSKCANI